MKNRNILVLTLVILTIVVLLFYRNIDLDFIPTTHLQSSSDDKNLTAMAPKNADISDDLLPTKVFDAQMKKIRIVGQYFIQSFPKYAAQTIVGTGFAVNYKSKIVILSARHIVINPIFQFKNERLDFQYNEDGLPEGINYKYQYYGIVDNVSRHILFPITLAAMGEVGKHQDSIAFKFPENITLKTLTFARNINVGDDVYVTGYGPKTSSFPNVFGSYTNTLSDIIDYTFKGKLSANINDMPINQNGLKMLYRLRAATEPGFSGGPVLNSNGEVVAMIIEGDVNFSYALSSVDLLNFLNKNYNKF